MLIRVFLCPYVPSITVIFFRFSLPMETEAYIFDFGGVLININYQDTIDAFEKLGIEDFKSLYTQANQSDLFDDLETGKISPMLFINKILDLLPEGTTANQVVHAWNAMLYDIPKERLDLLDRLRKQHKVFMFSNTNSIHIDKALMALKASTDRPLEDFFDEVYLSHLMGDRKPNPQAFQKIIDDHGLTPSKTVFIDDSIQHIEGARSVGLQTIHLQGELVDHPAFS